jgi:hypothetical protein
VLTLDVLILLLSLLDILLQVLLLFESPLSSSPCHLSLHELNLIFSVVEELLLFLELLIQLIDMGLQVSACG